MPSTIPNLLLCSMRLHRQRPANPLVGDDIVNTFAFKMSGDMPDPHAAAADFLQDFYMMAHGSAVQPIAFWLDHVINSATLYMRWADQAKGTPGVEIEIPGIEGLAATEALPPETAICASYRAAPPYTARRRGRIYLGPFTTNVLDEGKVLAGAVTSINEACKWLAEAPASQDPYPFTWGVYSRTADDYNKIAEGYTNDHFDVQRSRDIGTEEFAGRTPAQWSAVVV